MKVHKYGTAFIPICSYDFLMNFIKTDNMFSALLFLFTLALLVFHPMIGFAIGYLFMFCKIFWSLLFSYLFKTEFSVIFWLPVVQMTFFFRITSRKHQSVLAFCLQMKLLTNLPILKFPVLWKLIIGRYSKFYFPSCLFVIAYRYN